MRTRFWTPILAVVVAITATACLPNTAPEASVSRPGVVAAINAQRGANGVGALAEGAQLDQNAQSWAEYLAATGQVTHQGRHPLVVGEAVFLGIGPVSNGQVASMWAASPGHRINLLDPGVTHVGVGVARDGAGRTFVVAEFGFE